MADDKQTTQATQATKPIVQITMPKITQPTAPKTEPSITQPAKEVKPVAVDKKGQFDYSNCKQVIVKKGETLLDIAIDNLITYEQLRYFNHMKKNNTVVHEGDVIYIPNKPVPVPPGK